MPNSELRRDLITKRWVVIATKRNERSRDPQDICVFCPGNEEKAPAEIRVYRNNGDTIWKVRVVPNKYGAFAIEGELGKQKIGVLRRMNGRGAHEVIISTPAHIKKIYDFSNDEMYDLLFASQERVLDLAKSIDENKDPRIAYILIFGNEGKNAGASKEHPHWQLIGLPIIPIEPWNEIESCREYWAKEDECLFCKLTSQEKEAKVRIISENDSFLSLCHYAGRFPFETWILPQNHRPLFEDGSQKSIKSLAEILTDTLKRIGKALDKAAFNIYFHGAPLHDRQYDRYYHFHIEILPRIINLAGFEFGTGFYINPTVPEEAAKLLREAV